MLHGARAPKESASHMSTSPKPTRRLPAPWSVEEIPAGFKVVDADGKSLAYVYGEDDGTRLQVGNKLTMNEACRVALAIAKLPKLLP